MSKRALGSIAIALTILIALVLYGGLNGLPRDLVGQIDSERRELNRASERVAAARSDITRDLQGEPDLLRAAGFGADRLANAAASLTGAQKDFGELERLRKENRRGERRRAEELLRHEKNLRTSAVSEASAVQSEANRLAGLKRELPKYLDLSALASTVQRAQSDWPGKKEDLDSRLDSVRTSATDARTLLEKPSAADADALRKAAALPAETQQLQTLTGQLYDSWDKVLVDLEERRAGESRDYNEKVKTIRTHLTDVAANKSEITSDEKWVEVPKSTYQAVEGKLGMTLEHKDAGKYDSESERVAQPAGFAYMAPPGQSNQYGHWEQRDGGTFWTFLPQYLILRELLWAHQYYPPSIIEYNSYRSAQRTGQTYYGRDTISGTATSVPKYGSHGTFTQGRYAGSQYVRNSGTYSSSKYSTQSGTYSGSKYGSQGSTYRPNTSPSGSGSGTTFGSGRSMPRSAPRSAPSMGRRYGGRRR